jgi:transposase
MSIMIGIDPHKASHTAVAIDDNEHVLDELRVRSSSTQTDQLRCWAGNFEERTWAVEGTQGLGYLLAQQLVACGRGGRRCSTGASVACSHVEFGPLVEE